MDNNVPSSELVIPALWERQAGEADWEWDLFLAYREMERGERSLLAAWQVVEGRGAGLAPERVLEASERWEWTLRVAEWDVYRDAERTKKRAELVRQQSGLELEMSRKLFAKAWAMLEFPVGRKEVIPSGDGRTIINMYPTDWKPSDVARLVETASKVGRLAAGMETAKVNVTVSQFLDSLPESVRRTVLPILAELLGDGGG